MSKTNEPSSPVQKVWKPELYKIQLEAPTPKPLHCNKFIANSYEQDEKIKHYYGMEYHGRMGHLEAEEILKNKADGTYLIRRSPTAKDYYTLSLRFNKKTKHFKIYYKTGKGHYLQEQSKHFDTIHDLVADGLVSFYMLLHAAPIIQEINQQTGNCYQQSPYMTLNRRKLRALSNDLRKSLIKQTNGSAKDEANLQSEAVSTAELDGCSQSSAKTKDNTDDTILPFIYEKDRSFS